MKSFLILLSCFLFLGGSCSKNHDQADHNQPGDDKPHKESANATLVNKTGFDGCGWVLQLDNGAYLEPTNLSDFNVELVDGKKVSVSYVEATGLGSICMIGKIVDIKSMKVL